MAAQGSQPLGPAPRANQALGAIEDLQRQHFKQLHRQQCYYPPAHHGPQRLKIDQAGGLQALKHRYQPQPAPEGQQQGQVAPTAQQGITPAEARQPAPQPDQPQQDV